MFRFDHVAIVGIGLIGASLALAMRANGYTGTISVADRSEEALSKAKCLALADRYESDVATAVRDAGVVILAVPVGAMGTVGAAMAHSLAPGAIVTDVGSVKGAVIAAMEKVLPPHVDLVPGHPVAGSENSGPEAGYPTLFENRWTILTPTPHTDPGALAVVADMWRGMGAKVEMMDAERHDLVLAITSHLPHLIAYSIVGTADDLENVAKSEVIKFSAGGFRDFTRLAASDPTMWRDVFLNNREAVLETLGRFTEDLAMLQRAIRWGEGDKLFDLFTRTRTIRIGIVQAGQETEAPDFGRPRTHPVPAPAEEDR